MGITGTGSAGGSGWTPTASGTQTTGGGRKVFGAPPYGDGEGCPQAADRPRVQVRLRRAGQPDGRVAGQTKRNSERWPPRKVKIRFDGRSHSVAVLSRACRLRAPRPGLAGPLLSTVAFGTSGRPLRVVSEPNRRWRQS